jgi:uncharacterized cupredoxin-like copper-binding protein
VRRVTTLPTLVLVLAAVVASVPVLLGTGCAAQTSSTSAVIRVSESDFKISAPKQLSAGDVTLRVRNRGPDAHELIVIKLGPQGLPFRSDGLTVDEDALEHSEAGALEPGRPGAVRDLELHLTRGRYALLCNMSGHFLGGMHRTLVVG